MRNRLVAIAVAMLTTAVTVTACGETVAGTPLASFGDVNPGEVAGLPVTDGPSGRRPGSGHAHLPVRGDARTGADLLAEDALADIYAYWQATMPRAFGHRFRPPRTLLSYDSRSSHVQVCHHDSRGVVNAMYCPADDSVSWDRGVLLPALIKQFGPLSVVTVLAHEMGHEVQFHLAQGGHGKHGITAHTKTIVLEQQADCYAGSFMRWAATGHAPHFLISTGRGLNTVLSALFLVRDRPGAQGFWASGAHGSAFDRMYAFQAGFSEGPKRCAKIDFKEIQQRQTEEIFIDAEKGQNGGNLPINAQTVALLQASLDRAFGQPAGSVPRIVAGNGGACPDGSGSPPASYCPDDNTVVIDMSRLQAIASPPTEQSLTSGGPNSPGGIGDFAAFAEIASRYALGVQHELGIPVDDNEAGLRTACLTGAWAGVTRHPTGPGPSLRLATGDLDEAVAELLTARSLISADVHGRDVPSGFARVEAFRIGFLRGSNACMKKFS